MKLIAFLLLFNSLLIGLFAKELKTEEINSLENYKVYNFTVGNINYNLFADIEKHSIINVKIHKNYYNDKNVITIEDIKKYINGDKVENSEILTLNEIKSDDDFYYYQYLFNDDIEDVFLLKIEVKTYDSKNNWHRKGTITLKLPEQFKKLKVYNCTADDDINYGIVEGNSIVNVRVYENGFDIEGLRLLMNEEEIENSEYINYLSNRSERYNRAADTGEYTYYQFFIKDVTNENLLPQIKFGAHDDENHELIKLKEVVKLRLKDESFENYKVYNYTISDDVTHAVIESNSIANIKIYSNYKVEENNRMLMNQEEIDNSEYVTILGVNKEGKCQPVIGCNGFVVYQLLIKEVTNEDLLPQLQFGTLVRNEKEEKEEKETVIFKLKDGELPFENYKIYDFIVGQSNENLFADIEKPSIINVRIFHNEYSKFSGDIKTFINGDKVENSEILTLNDIKSDDNFIYYQYIFKDDMDEVFLLKIEVTTIFPHLNMISKGIITLNVPEHPLDFKVYNCTAYDDINYVTVERNSVLNVKVFESDYVMDGKRILMNEEEIENSEYINLLSFKSENVDNKPINGKYTYYQFQIKNVTHEDLLPQIQFSTKEKEVKEVVKLRLKDESFDDYKIYNYTVSDDVTNAVIESNSIANIKIYSGFNDEENNRILMNHEEIENSEYITILGINKEGNCLPRRGCDGYVVYQILIKEVTDEAILPYLQFGTIEPNKFKKEKEVLIFKLNENNECSHKGYQCCSQSNTIVHYTDTDGEWGVENGHWCFFKKVSPPTPTCFSEKLGYPCCKEQNVVYTDKDGQWGIENDHWCGIISCPYEEKHGYSVCKTTTEVVYTDDDEWGVENNQWCILCKF